MPTTGIASIKQTLDAAQKTFTAWAKKPGTGTSDRDPKDLMDGCPQASSACWTS